MKLRPFQQELKTKVRQSWDTGHRCPVMVMPTGSGKTTTFCSIVHDTDEPALVMAHRQELVAQMSVTLGRYKIRHRIIAPDSTRKTIERLHMEEFGRRWVDQSAPVAAGGVDTLIRKDASDKFLRSVKLWIPDECFPAGTLVDGKRIETLRPGDLVTAFDEGTGDFHLRPVVRLFKNPMPARMVRLCVSHHVLECTEGHPFYTRRGWVEAADLTTNDEVLTYEMHVLQDRDDRDDGVAAVPTQENRESVLLPGVRVCPPRRGEESGEDRPVRYRYVLRVWDGVRGDRVSSVPVAQGGTDVLRGGVLVGLPGTGEFRDDGGDQSQVCQCQNDRAEPDAPGRNPTEGLGLLTADRAPSDAARRERQGADRSGSEAAGTPRAFRIHAANRGAYRALVFLPVPLQNRLWERRLADSRRSGRAEPRIEVSASAGREERRLPSWERVASVSVYEPGHTGNAGDGFVYNIEVDEFHTYLADGVVVHNCHHVLRENKWGKAIALLPANSRGLGPTATPMRADGKGLGAHAHGVADDLIVGPSMRESILDGMLCDYKIFAPPSTLNLSDVGVGADGEYKHDLLSKAVRRSSITGDVVRSYLKIAPGKLGITFAVDLAHAQELVDAYNAAGVPAALLSGDTDPLTRARVMREFKPGGKWLQLVNVDVLGEGVDVPACEVVSFARPTMSFGLYVQQFGRVLRLMLAPGMADGWGDLARAERLRRIAASSKPHGIIIDHVGQWERHGLPDSPRRWTLDARERGTKSGPSDAIPLRTCLNDASGDLCLTVFERTEPCCPACGWVPPILNRSRPEFVDGDLFELDATILAKLRGEADRLLAPEPHVPHGMPAVAAHGLLKQHRLRRDAQIELGELIELWAGWQLHQGYDARAAYKRFFFAFGVDVATARTFGRPEAEKLCADIQQVLDLHHIVKE